MNYWVLSKQIYKVLFIFISFSVKSQTYIIDNLKVVNEKDSVLKNVDVNIKIVHEKEYLKFYLDSQLYQTYKTTKPDYFQERVRFICWNKNYELQFVEVSDTKFIEKFIGFKKIYHIKQLFR